MPTAQEIQSTQGTRLNEDAPWMTYDTEMTEKLDANLAAAVAEYAERRYEDRQTSNQNKEALAEQREMSAETAKQYQWLTPEEYADQEQRIGRVMSHAEFITKLRDTGMHCWYVQHPHADKAVLMFAKDGVAQPEVVCWSQVGMMPELSLMRFDDHGAPLNEQRRGWRTCLLQIILKGFLTEEKADATFGRPQQAQAFDRYNRTLQSFRNAGGSLGC